MSVQKEKIYNESKTINCLLINTILRESKNNKRLYTTISVQSFIFSPSSLGIVCQIGA